ncbi:DUF4232 domain-containing protein [Tersicoccus sp. Bi-70]|uniref:DUF4232 domain-containing protein n=1 Tax=Tersicoccus sp. Bi-70 TaxID=1897634 RepID=UPI0011806680|nr:DUF4232 domain-containing protein [Tersicoccus sp. Bi-70]
MTSKKSTSAVVLGITAVALALSACAPSSTTGTAASSDSAGASVSASSASAAPVSVSGSSSAAPASTTAPSSPSASASASPSPSASASSAPASSGSTAAPSTPSAGDLPLCTASRLSGSAAALPGGGAAGSIYAGVTVKNTSDAACKLAGYPGVSFVGGGTGEQVGVPAQRDTSQAPVAITLKPGQSAQARLQITRAENYGQVCNLQPADGFRVFPPSATDALFLPYTANACGNPKIVLLHVGAFQPVR